VGLLLRRLVFRGGVSLLDEKDAALFIRELSLVVRVKRLGLIVGWWSLVVVWTALLLLLQHNVDVRSAARSSFRRRNVSST
jgi:hypothetical protein